MSNQSDMFPHRDVSLAGANPGREPDARLALDGGDPVRTKPFVTFNDAGGRTLGAEELAGLERVIASGMLSSTWGSEVPALELEFARLIGDGRSTSHQRAADQPMAYGRTMAVACSSGTAAIHLAVAAVDPEPGDEIITTPITDFGTVIPILLHNAVPVFADVDPTVGTIDPDSVRAAISDRTRAIIVVHPFGVPAPVEELRKIADEHQIVLIEDCAQAYLTEPEPGRFVGTYGRIGCFSLQQSKHITAGDGGLVVTDDPTLARRMRLFSDKGWPRDSDERTYLFLGANYRMTELQAAVARAQLGKLVGVVEARRASARRLASQVGELAGVTFPADPDRASYWMLPMMLDPDLAGGDNQEWARALRAEGILVSPGYIPRPLHLSPVLTDRLTYGQSAFPLSSPMARQEWKYGPGLCPNAERLVSTTLITLAWNENYTDEDVDDIAAALRKVHFGLTRRRPEDRT